MVKTTLYDLGYRNIRMEAFCDNKSVVDTVNKNYALKKPEKTYVNCAAALRSHVRTSEMELFHIRGKSNPADLLTKTLSLSSLQQQLAGEFLKDGFELIPKLKEKEIKIITDENL